MYNGCLVICIVKNGEHLSKKHINGRDIGPKTTALKTFSVFLFCLVFHTVSAVQAPSHQHSFEDFNSEQALAYSQAALQRHVGNHELFDQEGNPIDLSGFQGKPLIVSFIYTSCYHICPVITQNLAHAVNITEEAMGKDSFSVLTIGFDSENDTPQRMKHFAKKQGIDKNNWHFLSGSPETIKQASENFGFIFFPSSKGFDHLAQTTIVDAAGKIYRQVYGTTIEPTQIGEPLKELLYGKGTGGTLDLAQWINNIKLFCTVYDPSLGRYQFDYSIFLAFIIGLLCLVSVVVFLIHAWRVNKSSKTAS